MGLIKIRELLANYAHDTWAGWMRYLFSKSVGNADGSATIPKELIDRWKRQMNTLYTDLPESEKKSDRKEADNIIEIVHETLNYILNDIFTER